MVMQSVDQAGRHTKDRRCKRAHVEKLAKKLERRYEQISSALTCASHTSVSGIMRSEPELTGQKRHHRQGSDLERIKYAAQSLVSSASADTEDLHSVMCIVGPYV